MHAAGMLHCTGGGTEDDLKCMHGALDVLEQECAKVAELCRDAIQYRIMGGGGNDDATRLGDAFKPGGNIDTVAKEIVVFHDDVADIDSHPKLKTPIPRHGDVAFVKVELNLHCTTRGVNDACELDQKSIAGGLDDTAAMRGNPGIKNIAPMDSKRG
ncbi:hypothetical protein UP10_28175 [Bradyrhizobium sp. LTSPM299]|nr:hypothetical protein UP10_28175 [Bradyrhizobium sp. LTSPM299]